MKQTTNNKGKRIAAGVAGGVLVWACCWRPMPYTATRSAAPGPKAVPYSMPRAFTPARLSLLPKATMAQGLNMVPLYSLSKALTPALR